MKETAQHASMVFAGGAVALLLLYMFSLQATPAQPLVKPPPPSLCDPNWVLLSNGTWADGCGRHVVPPTEQNYCKDNGRHTGWFIGEGREGKPMTCIPHHHDNGQGKSDQPPMGPPGQAPDKVRGKSEFSRGHGRGLN